LESQRGYQVLPGLSNQFKSFIREESASQAEAWLNHVDSTATIHGWSEEYRLVVARSYLIDRAFNWCLSVSDQIATWATFKEEFTKTFVGTCASAAEKWRRLEKRFQQKGEPLSTY